MIDPNRIYPYNIISVTHISDENKEIVYYGIIGWSNTKFSEQTSKELYGRQ